MCGACRRGIPRVQTNAPSVNRRTLLILRESRTEGKILPMLLSLVM
jgi:hypothetical protein